ncbi:MAG: hypothetical protein LBE71_02245, partial [Dysgonamonadaceae bacterium]|nr:hypothetical protein [Dysgonamonadaceae bacterium]
MAKKAKVSYALFQSRIGNVASLTTTEKNNLVGAINELNSGVGDIGSQKGAANGIASLDATGKVPAAQLPAFVDDVLEYANLAGFPATGETGKIYVAKDTNKTYRWSGSAYVVISDTIALGETSSTAYRGDNGKTAYDHSQLTNSNPHGTTAAQVGAAPAAHVGAGGTAHPLATGTVNGFSSNDYTSAEKTKLS